MADKSKCCGTTHAERQFLFNFRRQLANPPDEYRNTRIDFRGYKLIKCEECETPLKLVHEIDMRAEVAREVAFYEDRRRRERQLRKEKLQADSMRRKAIRPLPGDGSSYFDLELNAWVYRASPIILARQPFRIFTPAELASVAIELDPTGRLNAVTVKER